MRELEINIIRLGYEFETVSGIIKLKSRKIPFNDIAEVYGINCMEVFEASIEKKNAIVFELKSLLKELVMYQ